MSQSTATTTMPVEPGSLPDILTLEEAAGYLRVSEADILTLTREQGLPGRRIGDQWRFLKAGLRHWLCSPLLQKRTLTELAGAWKDDPHLDEMLEQIYKERGRPMTEDEES